MNVTHIAIGLFNAAWQSAALILATGLGLRACRNVGARARCTLWSAVFFLSALLPVADLAMQRTLVVAPRGPEALPVRATALYLPPAHRRPAIRLSLLREPLVGTQTFRVAAAQTNPFVAPQRALQSIAGGLLAAYLIGMAFFGLRLARECFALLALKRRCTILPGDPFSAGRLPRAARLATSTEVGIPCVLGFVRPLVVLPADMLAHVSPSDLRRVVGHEAAHLERYDDWTNLLEQLVLAVFFYNPAMHFAARQISTEREIACDDSVVMRQGDTVNYAECLAALVHRASASRRLPVPGFHAGPRQIVLRIERLLDRAYSRSRRFGMGIAVTAATVLLLAVTGVGNTVPVLTDATAPVPPVAPKAPTKPRLAPRPKIARIVVAQTPSEAAIPTIVIPAIPPNFPKVVIPATPIVLPKIVIPAPVILPKVAGAPEFYNLYLSQISVKQKAMLDEMTAQRAVQEALQAQFSERRDSMLDALSASGYERLSVDELINLSDSGLSGKEIREYARLFGHPSVDELRALANHGVSPAYVAHLQSAGLQNLTVRDAIRLQDNGVSPAEVSKYIRALRGTSIDDIIRLHDSGVE